MRRTAFALVLMVASGWAMPSQAQWWGGGWGRPCFGACRPWVGGGGWAGPRRFVVLGEAPRPTWDSPGEFGPPRFRAPGWRWGRMMWRREMRWRRFEAWRRRADAERQVAATEADQPRLPLHRWTRWRHPLPISAMAARPEQPRLPVAGPVGDGRRGPNRAEAAVAMLPVGVLHLAQPRVHAAVPSRMLAAALFRRPTAPSARPASVVPAVIRVPEPPTRPADVAPRRSLGLSTPRAEVRPAGLRSQPPTAAPSQPFEDRPTPAPAAPIPEPAQAAPADVPVAPLD